MLANMCSTGVVVFGALGSRWHVYVLVLILSSTFHVGILFQMFNARVVLDVHL